MSAVPFSEIDRAPYLAGEKLWGDDLDLQQIEKWYEAEQTAYGNLVSADAATYRYTYHPLNLRHGFRHVPRRRYDRALGFGSAWAEEFAPIADLVGHLSVIEPGESFRRETVCGIPAEYTSPVASGDLPYADATFDLITCLGALHHVPNVSHVVSELSRCLKPDGVMLIREPIVSMGDWSKPRQGLTANERGIPLALFRQIIENADLRIVRESFCGFPVVRRLWRAMGRGVFDDRIGVLLDDLACRLSRWNLHYHATSPIQKLAPSSAFYVLMRS